MMFVFLFIFFLHADSPATSFQQGVEAYQNEDFQNSTEIFKQLAEETPTDHHALFNLGLSLFKEGRVGFALGIWRKIQRQHPSSELDRAILFAESSLGQSKSGALLRNIQKKWLLLILWLIASVLFFLCFRRGTLNFTENRSLGPLFWTLLFSSVCTIFLCAFLMTTSTQMLATVINSDSPLYSSPNAQSAPLETLSEGEVVSISKIGSSDWVQIQSSSGMPGWVPKNYLIPEKEFEK